MSVVSADDHWLFISSNGVLTAGRRSPDHPLFPYTTVDKIHDAQDVTGSKTLILATAERVDADGKDDSVRRGTWLWEPFSPRYDGLYRVRRTLYKNVFGNIIRFEETNEDLGLTFAVEWCSSRKYGFVKRVSIRNDASHVWQIRILDGIQNLMPHGVPKSMQSDRSVLVDAYKKNELSADTGLGIFRLSARPVDRPEPSEALKATTVWSSGLEADAILLSTRQLNDFRQGKPILTEESIRGQRCAYFIESRFDLNENDRRDWMIVADIEQDTADVIELNAALERPGELARAVEDDVRDGTDRLRSLVGSSDGFQATADSLTTARHYSNVLFNVMRGGVFDDGYVVDREDLITFIRSFNRSIAEQYEDVFEHLPARSTVVEVLNAARAAGPQIERICYEYLPLIFSRRHGDPSRPWNHFTIDLYREDGSLRHGYEGNWRDIFQNWEALSRSFPEFIAGMIAKFVNASTADGYNPYRISEKGIDWEVTDPEDPWSYIGYWGDHQIVYLLALLELARDHYPALLPDLLDRRIFAYANVPYRIKTYAEIVQDPRDTIVFDEAADREARRQAASVGADGKLMWRGDNVVLVPLAEKLLVPLLAKLTNFVPDGGIWLNTQRPEWNDANNALVGNGLSMVTLYHMRPYLALLQDLFSESDVAEVELSVDVAELLVAITTTLEQLVSAPRGEVDGGIAARLRKNVADTLGEIGCRYRTNVYESGLSESSRIVAIADVRRLIAAAIRCIDDTIAANRGPEGLYHSYNLMSLNDDGLEVEHLYLMLEGQAAVLESGVLSPEQSLELLQALRASALYRADQHSYILYPDRALPSFIDMNVVPPAAVQKSPLLQRLLAEGNRTLVIRSVNGGVHFNGAFRNKRDVKAALDQLAYAGYKDLIANEREAVLDTFEEMFDHRSYTGRSGTFFGYEGLGSIYWHMVSKLALAVQRTAFRASDEGADAGVISRLVEGYYDIRSGLGTHKQPAVYGGFPTDPYSHTPAHAGAQQPGMTGQVKEDILCRWGELGMRVIEGEIVIDPLFLKGEEFLTEPQKFHYYDLSGRKSVLALEEGSLAFTYCQVPFLYSRAGTGQVRIVSGDGSVQVIDGLSLGREHSGEIFGRTGAIARIEVDLVVDS